MIVPSTAEEYHARPRFQRYRFITQEEGDMVRMFVRHKVKDYRKWRKAYDAFDKERATMGVTGHAVYRSLAKPNEITVSHDFSSVGKAKTFARSARLKEVMKGGGVTSAPTIWFVKAV